MTSPVDTSVKFAHSSMAGAPTISGQAGSRITAIRAFAVTGFGVKAVDGGATIAGGKCRLPFSSGASAAMVGSVILVSNALPAGLNGQQKVTSFSTTWVEFETALPDGAVTGSVSFKIAPLGFEEVFSKPNVSVFRPTDPASSRPFIRVDDSNASYANVRMYENMTDVDTGFNGGDTAMWPGANAAGAAGVHWTMLGDSRALYFCVAPLGTAVSGADGYPETVCFCGDMVSDRGGDPYPAALVGASDITQGCIFSASTYKRFLMRQSSGIGQSLPTTIDSMFAGVSGFTGSMGAFPSRAANALMVAPVHVADGGTFAAVGRRGVLPGALFCPQSNVRDSIDRNPSLLPGSGAYAGKQLLTVCVAANYQFSNVGVGFFDTTGPWRPQ